MDNSNLTIVFFVLLRANFFKIFNHNRQLYKLKINYLNIKYMVAENRIISEGLTFDDVLLIPSYSEVLPRDVNIQSKFSKNINLNIPIVTAAMDTVTDCTHHYHAQFLGRI